MDNSTPDPVEEAVEQIVLDITALRDLTGSEEATTDLLRERFLTSDDGVIRRLVSSPPQGQPPRPLGALLIGAGELVFGALLAVGGLILIVPSVLGFASRGDLANYLADLALGLSSPGLSDPLVGALGFGVAIFLLLASLYTLGQASQSLGQSGLLPQT